MNRVKAELSHNPYLLETDVRFNGREPKINSLVEKYRLGKLQEWIEKLPEIFYNEMNGWDFDLDFSGTEIDFEYLQAAFDGARVSRDSVFLFHKNELGSAERKNAKIHDLLSWFEANPNRKFALDDFRAANAQIFDAGFSFVIVQGTISDPGFDGVVVENVADIGELERAVLEDTPILFCVNERNRGEFGQNLIDILKRRDVSPGQLFFRINPDLNRSQIKRLICDLGVDNPQIAESLSDGVIKQYLEVYPMTAFVRQAIIALRGARSEIGAVLQAENERSVRINDAIHQKIDGLDETIQKLKAANEKINQRDNFEMPSGLCAAKDAFILKIMNWRKKKIKINSDEEASAAAAEFESDANAYFKKFSEEVGAVFKSAIDDIDNRFLQTYLTAEYEDSYKADQESGAGLPDYALPALVPGLLVLKNEKYVLPDDSTLDMLKNMLGAQSQTEAKNLARVVAYIYQEWREYAAERTSLVLDEAVRDVCESLKDYYERVAVEYIQHLKALIERQTQMKDAVSARLSDDERKLQSDNDWFSAFQEKLREIERD